LVVPLSLAAVEVDGHEALPNKPFPRTMAAVVVAGRQLNGKVHGIERFIDADSSPHTGVSGVRG
jgi:hypothetical protein